ncbi:PDDEXK family nuclease [Lysobacter solisilvae (ex Woo and Kim 2020)]|uniref:TnsA endonuclease N-terminal domain-containing protein n=1 Tax=Agrilutibacter terrestris TaxID=2865112 RepID=A0A7H0FZZ5_9GAMM|nr:TnsA endonuclease N-terminal domain-containing protein [Lysobacter terrestris]QNP41611.1 TnsA endonuclease N-terminal domain-containing protein [Lysobacter terrestris]
MKLTMAKLAAAIQEGRGTGTGDAYQPWIAITRRTSSPHSNLNVGPVPYLKRLTHFLSRAERQFGLYLWWLGANDVREQYPLWPWPHLHPEAQIAPRAEARYHPGTQAIAEEAGITLHSYPGTRIAHVLTIDMIATVPQSMNPKRLIGISCKPKSIVEAGLPTDRDMERIELDRRYCVVGDIPFRLAHPEQLPPKLLVGLHAISPIERRATLMKIVHSEPYQKYVDLLQCTAYDRPAWIASKEAGARVGWSVPEEQRAFRIAIWHQHVDHDLSRGITTTRPLVTGGMALREKGRQKWFGEAT